MFCYCPTSLSICPPFGIFGAFPYFIKVTHAVFSDRDKRKKVGKKDFPCRSENAKYMIEEAAKGRSLVFHVGDISYARGYVRKSF